MRSPESRKVPQSADGCEAECDSTLVQTCLYRNGRRIFDLGGRNPVGNCAVTSEVGDYPESVRGNLIEIANIASTHGVPTANPDRSAANTQEFRLH